MSRKVFFSFNSEDINRALVVKNSWEADGHQVAGFASEEEYAEIKTGGDIGMRNWINQQLEGSTVTVVLVAKKTCGSRWVRYEIQKSKERRNGLLGVDISKIPDEEGELDDRCGEIPQGFEFYLWNADEGAKYLDDWIELAAQQVGR